MHDPSGADPPGDPADTRTWSSDDTGSHPIDRELERELVRAALFDGCATPRIGRFTVGERLGAGASSVVYAAWDDLLARRVAVKIFIASSSLTHQQVQHEARALAQLSHRHVVAVYDVGEWKGHAFIAMELIAGMTLARWQAARKRSITELAGAYLQAGRGLAAAHQAGLVHRDFKPANVMVAEDGRVVVTDFGLAGSVAPEAETTGLPTPAPSSAITTRAEIGTPAYVAPEQRRGATPHPSADIYSFSLALCEALIGWHPMQRDESAWRDALSRRVPRRLYEALCTGLAKRPSARGGTMALLLEALALPPRRGWQRGTVIAAAGLAAAVVVAVVVSRTKPPPPPPSPPPPPQFGAPSLHPMMRKIDELLSAPSPSGDRAAVAALRSLLLAPLPTEVRCSWPAPIVALALGDDHAVGLDDQGAVHACALDSGAISLATTGARCISSGPDGTIGVMDRDRRVRVVRAARAGWQAVRATVPAPDALAPPSPEAACWITILPGLGGAVRVIAKSVAVAADPSGRIVAIASRGEVQVTDHAGAELSSRRLLDRRLFPQLDVSRDGARVLVAAFHGPLLWWDASTGRWREERLRFKDPSLRAARLSPSGARALLLDHFGALEVRTLGGGRAAWLTSDAITDAVFHDDDTVIASDAGHRLWRWDLARQRAGIAAVHDRTVWSVASNAEIVASASEDGTVAVTDRRTGALRLDLRPAAEIYRIVLDRDHLIAAGNDGLRRWSWRTGAPAPLADGQGLRIWDVEPAIAADGARTYVAGALARGAIFAWTASARTLVHQSRSPGARVLDVAVSTDGRTAAAIDSAGTLVVIDVATGRSALQAKAHVGTSYRVAIDPASATIVTVGDDGYLRTWSPPETAPRRSIRITTGPVYALDVHSGHAITGSYDGSVTLVDLATGRIERRYRGHDSAVRTVRFRPDGRWLVTGDNAGRACLWRTEDDDCHTWLEGHRSGVLEATFTDGSDGTIFTTSDDGTVRYWRPTYDLPGDALFSELTRHGSRR